MKQSGLDLWVCKNGMYGHLHVFAANASDAAAAVEQWSKERWKKDGGDVEKDEVEGELAVVSVDLVANADDCLFP